MRFWIFWFAALLGSLCLGTSNSASSPDVVQALAGRKTAQQHVGRIILGLYHSGDEAKPDATRIHKFLEMPLNHLGYVVSYWDLKAALPPLDLLERSVGVATWFNDTIPDSSHYFTWAAAAARSGKKFLVFESPGSLGGPDTLRALNGFLAEFGLRHTGRFLGDTVQVAIQNHNTALIGYEEPLPPALPGFNIVNALPGQGKDLTLHLSVSMPGSASRADDTVLVSTNRAGSVVSSGYAIKYNAAKKKLTWMVDPIGLIAAAMGTAAFPVPDTTTLAGRRMYFSHIDGDGWNNMSHIKLAPDETLTSSEVVLRELIVPYPDLPVTVGLISCDIDPAMKGRADAAETARRLYALPQVEAASHTHTHPFEWPFYEHYNRARELARLRPVEITKPTPAKAAPPAWFWPWSLPDKPVAAAPRVFAKPGPPPRYNTEAPFKIATEVNGSLGTVQAMLPPGKRPEVYLWSGDTRPFEAAIKATRAARVRNLNGGDARYDSAFPSLAYLPPLARSSGTQRQIYAVNSNENTYTNDWRGPFDGFALLRETFDRTESPRRLRAMNVYYHMYSGERAAALAAVKAHLDHARASPVIPVTASRYAAIADSFFDVTIDQLGPLRWKIGKRGELQTIRFDQAEGLRLDLADSEGVLGQSRHNGSLYIALDSAHGAPIIALASGTSPSPVARPYLINSRWDVSGLTRHTCGFTANATGFGRGDMTWAGLSPGDYTIAVTAPDRPGESLTKARAHVMHDGTLALALDADARAGVVVSATCQQ
jgi:polysaccharide biosynthesis protein PelA